MPQTATISSASGETGFEPCPTGRGSIFITGTTWSAGKIVLAGRAPGAASDFILDYVDVTAFQEVPNEAGTGYSYAARFETSPNSNVALKADASFVGSVSAQINGDLT